MIRKRLFLKSFDRAGSISEACRQSKISRDSVYRWMTQDEGFKEAIQEIKDRREVATGKRWVKAEADSYKFATIHEPKPCTVCGDTIPRGVVAVRGPDKQLICATCWPANCQERGIELKPFPPPRLYW